MRYLASDAVKESLTGLSPVGLGYRTLPPGCCGWPQPVCDQSVAHPPPTCLRYVFVLTPTLARPAVVCKGSSTPAPHERKWLMI